MTKKPTFEEFILQRYGLIETDLVSPNQCKDKGHKTYEYLVRITCLNKLNNEGFLVDNKAINHVMKYSLTQMTSCEKLCEHYANALQQLFEDQDVPVCEMYVSLKPVIIGSPIKDFAAFELKRTYDTVKA